MDDLRLCESTRMRLVQTPIIPTIAKLISETPGTISLGQGVVNYAPPPSAMDKLTELNDSLENHKYGPVEGLPELIECIKDKLQKENKINMSIGNRVIVTAGANMGFVNALLAITDPGDEIIIQRPFYFNHEMAIKMLNCKAVVVSTDSDYQLNIKEIKKAITNKTRAIVTISPNNPCGVVYPESSLIEISLLCGENGIYHISDEAYEYFTYSDILHYSPASAMNTDNFTISLYSLSKSYGFAGWRIGYMVVPENLYAAILKIQDTNLICPAIASQFAAIGALKTGKEYCIEKLRDIIQARKIIQDELHKLDSLCFLPESNGAFYFFVKLHTKLNDMDIVEQLIKQYKIAVIPGHAFGMNEGCYIRISYGSMGIDIAKDGVSRLTNGIKSILQ